MLKTENRIQQEIFMYFNNTFCTAKNEPRSIIFSVPNDSKDLKEQLRKKATGLMAGVSDLIVIHNGKVLFVECKDDKGRQSDKQKHFQELVEAQGFKYYIVRSLEEFKEIFSTIEIN